MLGTAWLLACAPAAACPVALDVGHYLEQPGAASARGRSEFSFNLELAQEVQRALDGAACGASLIGAAGDMQALPARTAAARGAKLFLSIHHDSVQPRLLESWLVDGEQRAYCDRFAGFSLFVSRRNARLGRSLKCASAIGAALRSAGFTPSLYHADPLLGENRAFADRRNGVHYYDHLVVLKTATQPAVLFEAGVIVNRGEELALAQPQTRRRIAAAVARGVRACLKR